MTKKPIVLTSAALAAIGIGAGGVVANAQGPNASAAAAKPAVTELDADLVGGRTLVLTAETRRATKVTITYRGRTKTARLERLDGDDGPNEDRDATARFTAAKGDRTNGDRITAKVRATGGGKATTRTLTDRLDVETDDGDDD
jgi:hypothetical protein